MPLEHPGDVPVWVERGGLGVRRVLFIHCMLAHSGAWRGVIAPLNHKIKWTAFDLPGHGKSWDWDGQSDYQTQGMQAAAGLIDKRADLVGHSFGATIALRLARDFPDMVRSLTLIEPVLFAAAKGKPEFDQHEAEMARFDTALGAGQYDIAAQEFDAAWGPGMPWDAIPTATRDGLIKRMPLVAAGAGATVSDVHKQVAPGALEQITQPVLLMEGSASPSIIRAVHDVFFARLPDVRRVVVAGAGHMVPITHPEAVAGEVGAFLKV
ncbi:MAG TPA: alpha/beta hydrolase [Aliiroseovarius sp.]|nr:alpha/beta hydrolase [Aliiroseovarius sp.]